MGNDITRREHDKTFGRPTTETHVFHLQPFQGYRLEMGDVHFHHDSAVLLPDYDDKPDASKVTALAILAAGLNHARKNPKQLLLIAGHTDTTGQNDYNLGLSELRAKSVYYALTGDKDGWVGVCQKKFKVEDYQLILKWAHDDLSFDSDPGKIDNTQGPKTEKATKRFQEQYNEDYGASIPTNGVVGAETWGAFFHLYMEVLEVLLKVDHAGLVAIQNSLKWVKDGIKLVGCGEEFPIDQPQRNAYNSKTNRRVEMLFFDPGQEPKLDCHPGPGKTVPILCEIYNPWMYRYKNIPAVPIPIDVPAYDLQNVRTAVRIAPEKEKVKIEYDITNIRNLIRSGTWSVLRKSDSKVLKTTALTADQWTQGPHAIEWDGSVTTDAEFPDGFVTLEHSPYIVKVAIDGRLGPREGQAEIKVELDNFVVELAPKDRLTEDRDKKIWATLPAIPAGAAVKLKLPSDLFAVDSDEMYNNTAYTQYQTLWDDGPRIPLVATVTILDSQGKAVRAAKALGRAKVVWDFTDPAQNDPAYLATALAPTPGDADTATNSSQGAKPFVDAALKYDKTNTRPADGDNGHVDRGGKRDSAAGASTNIFGKADAKVTNFPYVVNPGGTRWWAGFADFQKAGDLESRAGAVFRPARMAGDNYGVKAYLDLRKALDTADAAPAGAEREVAVGTFEVWRQITLPEHFKKSAAVTRAMPDFAKYYVDAFLEVDDKRGGTQVTLTKAQYDTLFNAAQPTAVGTLNGWGGGNALVAKYSLPAGVSQYDAPKTPHVGGGFLQFLDGLWQDITELFGAAPPPAPVPTSWVASFISYNDFKAAVKSGEGLSNADLATSLTNGDLADEKAYAKKTKDFAIEIASEMCKAKATKNGVTVLQFDWASSIEDLINTKHQINGNACFKSRNVCGFALYNAEAGAEQTPAHEIGHCMFLPHATRLAYEGGAMVVFDDLAHPVDPKRKTGIARDRHDDKNRNCLMSYSRPRPGFCGLCLVRLRGWDASKFNRLGSLVNKA